MTISSNSRKAGPFIGNGTAATFPFTFKVFQASDLEVVKLTVATNIETILVLNTDFTATINADQNSSPGGTITLSAGALAAGFNLVITSDIENLQPTDLTNQGGFYPEVITDALDRATIQIQQLQEAVDRSAKLPITSAADADALVADIVRIADSADNLDTVANNIDDVNDVADDITNVNTVASSISGVNTVAGNISNVNTVAGVSSNVTTVAGSISNVNTTATNIANVNTAATNISAINTVASDLNEPTSEIEVVANNITNVNTVGNNISNVNTVAGVSSNVTTVAGIAANVTTVAGISGDVSTVASISGDVQAVENIAANVTTVAGIQANVTTVAGVAANVTTVAGISSNVTTVAGISADVTAVAADAADIGTVSTDIANVNIVAANIAAVNTAASDMADIIVVANDLNEAVSEIEVVANNITSVQTVGDDITNVNTVATNISDVNTVAGDIANVNTVAGNTANIDTVAGINADVTTVAGIAADVTTVATNVADITNFSDVYQGPKATAPSLRNDGGALQLGDLYFNTSSNAMFVYASTGWVPAGSSVNGTSRRFRYIATSGQTTFTGTDSNGNTMAYDAGFVDVYLNGVRLDQTDYTASSGTSIVLASGAALNDELNVVAFGTFSVASIDGVDLINGTVSANKLAAGVAVSNIGYTPVNKAGDAMTGRLDIHNSTETGYAANISESVSKSTLSLRPHTTDSPRTSMGSLASGVAGNASAGSGYIQRGNTASTWDLYLQPFGGRVLMPFQPTFHARISSNTTYSAYALFRPDSNAVNLGNCYSSATGLFTAPVAGMYELSATFLVNPGGTSSSYLSATPVLNGSSIGGTYGAIWCGSGSFNVSSIAGQFYVYLNANDTLGISLNANGQIVLYASESFMSVRLVG